MTRARALALAIAALSTAGCGNPGYRLPSPVSCIDVVRPGLTAESVRVEVTPPIGLSLIAHGAEGRIAVGALSRLRCRGIVLRWPGDGVAWITCDLGFISMTLHRRMAAVIRESAALGADRLILTGTHTHAGPTGFFETEGMQSPLGATRDPAYDDRVTEFIARRVGKAVAAAWNATRPAAVSFFDHEALGLNRSRALAARTRDPEYGAPSNRPELDPAHREVDRRVPVIRVDRTDLGVARGSETLLGVIGVFNGHNTALPNTTERYAADLYGVAASYCESELATAEHAPVCAVVPGTHGDASPDWGSQDEDEMQRLGARLGWHLVHGAREATPVTEDFAVRYQEVVLPGASYSQGSVERVPEIGTPIAAGAADGIVRFRVFEQMNPGVINVDRHDGHAPRNALLGFVPSTEDAARDGWMFSPIAPMHALRLGGVVVVTLPFEPTTAVGERVARGVARGVSRRATPTTRVITVGHSDNYAGYLVTREEFGLQLYEGASCYYGPGTAQMLVERATALAGELGQSNPRRQTCTNARAPAAPARWDLDPPDRDPGLCDDIHPRISTDAGVPPTDLVEDVGDACARPAAGMIRRRWPDGLDLASACPDATDFVATTVADLEQTRVDPNDPLVEREVSWRAPLGEPGCGGARAVLVDERDHPLFATRAPFDPAAGLYPDPVTQTPWEPATAAGLRTLEVSDANDFIEVWADTEDETHEGVRWRARFRAPHAARAIADRWRSFLAEHHARLRIQRWTPRPPGGAR